MNGPDNSHHPRLTSLAVVLFATLAATLPTPAAGQFDGPSADEVRAREIAFAKTMADRDLEAFLSFIAPDAVFFAGNQPLRGRDAVEQAWKGFFEGDEAPFSWSPDLVQVMDSGGLALSSGPVVAASGEVGGRFNSIWRRDSSGVWWIVFDKGS